MSAPSKWISTCDSPPTTDVNLVGGKAKSLFWLQDIKMRVPRFFVVTTQMHRDSASGTLSASMRSTIAQALDEMGLSECSCAVRSSGIAEDSADHSYAGVFETVLDVRGESAIMSAIEHCWTSHQSDTAISYRTDREIQNDSAIAVIVQQMVEADWSGVSFSADPICGALSICTLNVTRGLGEELMAGHAKPEEFRFERATGRLVSYRQSDAEECCPRDLCAKVVAITDEIAQYARFPQDIEWAAVGNDLFVLQSRPITTLAGIFHNRSMEPWAGAGDPDNTKRVWTRAYADEIWAPPVSPLFYDIQNLTAVTANRLRIDGDPKPVPPDIFKYYRAAVYMDVDVLARLYTGLPRFARRSPVLSLFPPDSRDIAIARPWRLTGAVKRLWQFEVRNRERWGVTRNYKFLSRAWPSFLNRAQELAAVDLTSLSDEALEEQIANIWALALTVAHECEVAVLYYAHDIKLVLIGLLDRWCGLTEADYAEVSTGLEESLSVIEADQIWEIATLLRGCDSGVQTHAVHSSWKDFSDAQQNSETLQVISAVNQFLTKHPHRGANYKDVIYARWGDNPEILWSHIKSFLKGAARRPSEVNKQSARRREVAQRNSIAAVKGPVAWAKRIVLRRLLRLNEIYAGIRDNHRYYYDYVWWLIRQVYLEVGRRSAADGLIQQSDDIFFLSRSEISSLRSGSGKSSLLAERIRIRRSEWTATKNKSPAKFLRNGYLPDPGIPMERTSNDRLTGLAASSGDVRGRARIALDVTDLRHIGEGDILVTRQTDPGWTPAFCRLGGLVLETGGTLAHGASLCREYGLPCVTDIENATSNISDGDIIFLSGGQGFVEIIERQSDYADDDSVG